MTSVTKSRLAAASIGHVWGTLADFGAISAWAPNVEHSCLLSEQSSGVGTIRRVQVARSTVVETVEIWVQGRELSYRLTGLPSILGTVRNTWTLAASEGGTLISLTSDVRAGPRSPSAIIGRPVSRLAVRMLGRASDVMLDGLCDWSIQRTRLDEEVDDVPIERVVNP